MRSISLTVLLCAALATKASVLEPPIPGYTVDVQQWDVQATPNGAPMTLNGTAEEVIAQLRELNPNYDEDFGLLDAGVQEGGEDMDTGSFSSAFAPSERRDVDTGFPESDVICNNFATAEWGSVRDAVRYLNRVPGQPRNIGGPGRCGRVSCAYYSAVWWCNDNPEPKTLDSFREITKGVYMIQTLCTIKERLSGQAFHPENYNVVVKWENC